MGLQMFQNAPRYDLAKANGHSIPYQSPQMMERNRIVGSCEPVLSGECLQQGSLAQGYGAILLWVAEPSVPKAMALRRHGRCGVVPRHPSVDAWVRLARFCFVTISY
jgi:hypothetical protein